MQKIKFKKILIFICALIFILSSSFSVVNASTLRISPEAGSYSVGDTIYVKVMVSSPNESINAVSSRLNFSQENLSLISISKSGSIISIWAQEPTFSNAAGSASFEGVTLGGYTGSGATVVSLSFRARAEGRASINFTSGAVLANDGEGTNTLTGQNEATFIIGPAPVTANTEPTNTEPKNTVQEIKEKIKEVVQTKPENKPGEVIKEIHTIEYRMVRLDPMYVYMIIAWVALLFVVLYLYIRYKIKVKKRIKDVEGIIEESFEIFKEDEKEKSIKTLDRDFDDAEKVIIDKMKDIEKM